MNVDNNPFQCTDIMKKPPYGPFGSDAHDAYEVCGSNTFGPYAPLINYEIASTQETIKYEIAMGTIRGILDFTSAFVEGYGAYLQSQTNSRNDYLTYCTRGVAIKNSEPSSTLLSAQQFTRCKNLLKRWYKNKKMEELNRKLETLPTNEEVGEAVISTLLGPFDSDQKVYTLASVSVHVLNGALNFVEQVRAYSVLDATRKWTGELGPVLLNQCKYASSKDNLPLHLCNFKAGGAPNNRDTPRHCFLPLKGKLPTGEKNEVYITVTDGVKVSLPEDAITGGIIYLKRFLDDLSLLLGTKKSAASGLPHLTEVAITVSETATTINCIRSGPSTYYSAAADTKNGDVYNFALPMSVDYQGLNPTILGTCNHTLIDFTPHYMAISDACHSLG